MNYVEGLRKIIGHRPIILVGSVIILKNSDGEILLQQRKHPYGYWGLPGGLMELGESTEETAKRELYEETNLSVHSMELVDVFSGADQFIKAPNNDEFYTVTIAYHSSDFEGEPVLDTSEGLDLKFFAPDELPLKIVASHQKILKKYFTKFKNE